MEDNTIHKSSIRASAVYKSFRAWKGRLNGISYWATETGDPWIQANIGYQTSVYGVITQGGGVDDEHWVTHIKVSTFLTNTTDEESFIEGEDGNQKVSKHM